MPRLQFCCHYYFIGDVSKLARIYVANLDLVELVTVLLMIFGSRFRVNDRQASLKLQYCADLRTEGEIVERDNENIG